MSTTPPWSRRARRLVAVAALVAAVATSACAGTTRLGGQSSAVAATRGVGVFRQGGTTPASVAEWERWVGRRLTHASAYFTDRSWSAMIDGASWKAREWRGTGKTLVAGVPLAGGGLGSLAHGAAGGNNGHFRALATG